MSSAVGYAGSQFKTFFLMLYLVAGTVSTTLQLLLVLGIFGAQDRVADEIMVADSSSGTQHFDRWVAQASPVPGLLPWTCLLLRSPVVRIIWEHEAHGLQGLPCGEAECGQVDLPMGSAG